MNQGIRNFYENTHASPGQLGRRYALAQRSNRRGFNNDNHDRYHAFADGSHTVSDCFYSCRNSYRAFRDSDNTVGFGRYAIAGTGSVGNSRVRFSGRNNPIGHSDSAVCRRHANTWHNSPSNTDCNNSASRTSHRGLHSARRPVD